MANQDLLYLDDEDDVLDRYHQGHRPQQNNNRQQQNPNRNQYQNQNRNLNQHPPEWNIQGQQNHGQNQGRTMTNPGQNSNMDREGRPHRGAYHQDPTANSGGALNRMFGAISGGSDHRSEGYAPVNAGLLDQDMAQLDGSKLKTDIILQ
jgi:hypothetical protein